MRPTASVLMGMEAIKIAAKVLGDSKNGWSRKEPTQSEGAARASGVIVQRQGKNRKKDSI